MNQVDLLLWARGPLLHLALIIFIFGVTLRLIEILSAGRKIEYATKRGNGAIGGLRTLFSRFVAEKTVFHHSAFIIITGYIFHIGLFLIVLFFIPHILIIQDIAGFSWPGLPSKWINGISIITMMAMIALLVNRFTHPVLRFLSTFQDYLTWSVTFLPILTGYMAFNHMLLPYPLMLALHLLSVELLLILFPFTKLMHTFTAFISRWYTGMNAAHRGVRI